AYGEWGETAATVALCALAVRYPHRTDLAAHVFAERATAQGRVSAVDVVETDIGLALLLAPVDRAAARTLLEAAEPRTAALGKAGGRGAVSWEAWGRIAPTRATPLLLAKIDRLKTNRQEFHKHCDLLGVLDIMTAPPAQRLELLARQPGSGWPSGELE